MEESSEIETDYFYNPTDQMLESHERNFHLRQNRVIGAFQSLYWHMRHVDKADITQRIQLADMTDCSLYDLDDIQKASEDSGIAFDLLCRIAARLHNEDSSDRSESPRPLAWRIDTSPESPDLPLQVPSAGASDGAALSHSYNENEFCFRSSDGAGSSSDRIGSREISGVVARALVNSHEELRGGFLRLFGSMR